MFDASVWADLATTDCQPADVADLVVFHTGYSRAPPAVTIGAVGAHVAFARTLTDNWGWAIWSARLGFRRGGQRTGNAKGLREEVDTAGSGRFHHQRRLLGEVRCEGSKLLERWLLCFQSQPLELHGFAYLDAAVLSDAIPERDPNGVRRRTECDVKDLGDLPLAGCHQSWTVILFMNDADEALAGSLSKKLEIGGGGVRHVASQTGGCFLNFFN